MIEILAAVGLALAAGLNAYLPLLAVSLLARFTEMVVLPESWQWMERDWILVLFALLVIIEFIADKVAVIDSLNDIIQTAVRPTSGGLLFAATTQEQAVPITSFTNLIESAAFPAFAVGLVIALIPHLMKLFIRPLINTATGGMATAVVSFGEDLLALALIGLAVFIPILVPLGVLAFIFIAAKTIQHFRKNRRNRAESAKA